MNRLFERTLAFVGVCTMCIVCTSCGNDAADQQAQPPAVPAKQPAAAPRQPAAPKQQPAAPVAAQTAAPTAADSRSEADSQEKMAQADVATPEQPSAVPVPVDEWAELENLMKVAQLKTSDFQASARAWAGDDLKKRHRVCQIAMKEGRTADLLALARDVRKACTGQGANFANFMLLARYFKAGASLNEAREALNLAKPLAKTREQMDLLVEAVLNLERTK